MFTGNVGGVYLPGGQKVREQGKFAFNLYLDKIPEEIERKQRRLGMNLQESGKGMGLLLLRVVVVGGRGMGVGDEVPPKGGR